jgi:hypothetical protein
MKSKIINKAPVIGFVRYSQKVVFGNKDRNMFDPEYFEYRYAIFNNVTLKSFQQQTNQNFVLLLLHSENMPSHYKERFFELENKNPFLYNVFIKDTQESFNEAILNSVKYVRYENDAAVTFRIDNDDAVQSDFIAKISGFLKHDFNEFSLSIPLMYIVKRISNQLYMLQESYFPANAIGLAYVTGSDKYKTIFNVGDHDLINNENKMISLETSRNGGLMTINGENAINSMNETKAKVFNEVDLSKYLKEKNITNINLDCLRIFDIKKHSSKFVFKKMIELFLPPIFYKLQRKINSFFS